MIEQPGQGHAVDGARSGARAAEGGGPAPVPFYSDELVTLYHGDCRELIGLLSFTAIVTDPPYGIGWETDGRTRASIRHLDGSTFPPIHGDDGPFDPAFLLEPGRPTALFGANHYADRLPASPAWIVWDKRVGMESTSQSDCELVWTNVGGRARMIRYLFNGGGSLARENGVAAGRGRPVAYHPTQKPVRVMSQILQWVTRPTDVVLDPFAGSGSTLMAAKRLGRRAVGIEIAERYCVAAAERLSQGVLGLGDEEAV